MTSFLNCAKLRAAFEGREAYYREHGLFRVRVTNIRWNLPRRFIEAYVEEIPTPGLVTVLQYICRNEPRPLRWSISGGKNTIFSDQTWRMGYGGWTLFFAPAIVDGLTRMAANWADDLDVLKQYKQANEFLDQGCEPETRVFVD